MKRQQLAKALDLDVRTLQRYLGRGMPAPAEGESLPEWVERASKWKAENKKAPGPKKSPASEKREQLELEILEEKLSKLRLENETQRGDLHSKKQCEAEEERNYLQVAQALISVGAKVARKCYQAASPDVVQVIVDDEIRRCLAVLSAAKGPASGPAPGAEAS